MRTLWLLAVLFGSVACTPSTPEERGKARVSQIKFASNYCFTNLRGQKTWASFVQRNDVLKVTPQRRDMPVTRHKETGSGSWKNIKGKDTYQIVTGGAVWKANDGSGKRIQMRKC